MVVESPRLFKISRDLVTLNARLALALLTRHIVATRSPNHLVMPLEVTSAAPARSANRRQRKRRRRAQSYDSGSSDESSSSGSERGDEKKTAAKKDDGGKMDVDGEEEESSSSSASSSASSSSASSSSSGSSSESSSGSDDDSESDSGSDSDSDSDSDSGSEESEAKGAAATVSAISGPSRQRPRYPTLSPTPPPAEIPSFLPPRPSDEDESRAQNEEDDRRTRFRNVYMEKLVEGFGGDLEKLRSSDATLSAARLQSLIDSLAAV
ncbi:hypothetical protein EHS25_005031 [Saitozyma podzolica]|uniref:Ribosome-assembly protein 3 C-terminal domain-containing protein n=1 Tax=Saitozyma podzolica TaxID=1890683 RepID=A0A427Y266_9TREE|nr:hypothetical protein EHS25_005031 [Saitozyma podzolica]